MAKNKHPLSIINHGLTINGEIECNGEVIIKGNVSGKIKAEILVIADTGCVEADCEVGTVIIGGDYNGNLTVNGIMKILSSGKCSGKVLCQDMVVENGSTLNASVDCSLTP
ncbi:MAG: polymer-forming cytoskeletal protein [Candidatus Magnetomorum sp.]|nr:polymer-forming cytoskeletal protein [Candidatus Magnetomorum sp.]